MSYIQEEDREQAQAKIDFGASLEYSSLDPQAELSEAQLVRVRHVFRQALDGLGAPASVSHVTSALLDAIDIVCQETAASASAAADTSAD